MLAVLSPAKKLNFDPSEVQVPLTTPQLLKETRALSETTRQLEAKDLKSLMKLSDGLARLNFERFQSFDAKATRPRGSKQAALAFDGDTYVGLRAREMSSDDLAFAQEHVWILSGLYGLLRPLDAIQPYRLEMGSRLATPRGKTLYDFWGNRLARALDRQLAQLGSDTLVNLASNEYFSAVPRPALKARVVTCVFKEMRGGQPKIISFSAKRARGTMARFIVEKRITDPDGLKRFREDGYRFVAKDSDAENWLFLRG